MAPRWKRNIVLFLASQTLSLFGSSLVQYAIMWHITLATQSGSLMTIYIICGFLPTFFLSPFAGVWADRYNRKLLIILSDSFIALATLVLGILFLVGYDELWLLFVVPALRALGTAVQTPAVSAFIPQLVPEDKLTKVNAMNGTIQSLVMLASPMVSVSLFSVAPLATIFFIDVITALIAVTVLFLFLRVAPHSKALTKQTVSYFKDMKAGFVYIRAHKFVSRYFLFCACFFVLIAPAAFLTPLQVTRNFGEAPWRLSAIEVAFSVGMLLGGAAMMTWSGFTNKIHTMTLATWIVGASTVGLGVMPNFWIYLGFMALVGVAMPLFNTPSMVMLQERVEENYLGRVMGVLAMISSVMMPMGMLVFGPLADWVKIEWLLLATGILMFIQSFFLLGSKALIEAGKPKVKPAAE